MSKNTGKAAVKPQGDQETAYVHAWLDERGKLRFTAVPKVRPQSEILPPPTWSPVRERRK